MSKEREHWGSHIGFILATVGSAVGLGNIWRFPTIVGREGGGVFIAVFLIAIVIIGIPAMIGELTLGRKTQRSVIGAFLSLQPNSRWWIAGFLGALAGTVILSFYSVIAGWGIWYIGGMITGKFQEMDAAALEQTYESFVSHPYLPLLFHFIFLALTIGIVIVGIKKGIERWGKILMPGIILIILMLMIRSLTLPGALSGVIWLFRPDWNAFRLETLLLALGQVFFSFSLGMGAILTYGSYLDKETDLPQSALQISIADLLIALITASTIIPAVFAFGLQPEIGPGLVFVTLPAIFNTIAGGNFFGAAFFIMFFFAALTSGVALLEIPVASLVDQLNWKRTPAALFTGGIIFLLGIPSALSQGILADFLIGGRHFLDFVDFVTSSILLPLGGLLTTLFIGWVWGPANALKEITADSPLAWLGKSWAFSIKYIIPLAIALTMIAGFFL